MVRAVQISLFLCSAVLIVSCTHKYRLDRLDVSPETNWPFSRGMATGTGGLQSGEFTGELSLLWLQELRDKPAGPLTIHNGVLIYAGTKKKARFFDLTTGQDQGALKLKGVPQTGLLMHDSIAFFGVAPKRSRLYGVNLVNGRTVFSVPVKDPSPGPIIANNRLLISSGDGSLVAFDLDGYQVTWQFRTEGRFIASPSAGHGKIFQPCDRGALFALSPIDGHEIFSVETDGPLVSSVAVGKWVYAADMLGNVYAISPVNGAIIWRTDIGQPVWSSPAVDDSRVIVGHSGGGVVALDASSGDLLWSHETSQVVRAAPVIVDDWVLVGTMSGNVVLLNADDGLAVASHPLKGAIFFPPVTDGQRLFVATQSGKVACFGAPEDADDHDNH